MAGAESQGGQAPGSLVRSFMATGGRTTAASASVELPLETLVSRAADSEGRRGELQFESLKVYDFADEPVSIAEIAAEFRLPMRAAIVLCSEMTADGVLQANETVVDIDIDFLLRIRAGIEAL